jgi:hypothetical protein
MKRSWIYLLLGIAFLFSCGDEASELGLDFFDDGVLDLSYIDTSTVKLYTVKFDSLPTSNTKRILAGTYFDETLGRITCIGYFQPGVSSAIDLDENSNYKFEYAALTLKYDRYTRGDTLQPLHLKAFRLAERLDTDDGYIYNTSKFKTADYLGSAAFSPRPLKQDSAEIVLTSSFGQELFNKAMTGDKALSSSAEFLKYIPGVVVIPDTTHSASVIGFATTSELRLYYQDYSVVPHKRKYISFPTGSNLYSSRIVNNFLPEAIRNITSYKDKVSSDVTNGVSFIQESSGLALRVDLPHIRALGAEQNFYMTKAELELYVVKKSYDDAHPLPGKLNVLMVDKNNVKVSETLLTSTLHLDHDLGRSTRYVLDVTNFVKRQINRVDLNEDGLLLMTETFSSGLDRVLIAENNNEFKTRLKIYYATLND